MQKPIWAPWRLEYVVSEKPKNSCFLCDLFADQKENDPANLLLKRGNHCGIVMNRYPYNNGHLMVTPYRHISEISDLTPEEESELALLTKDSVAALRSVMNPDGFNIGINLGEVAGAGLKDHIHRHIVPRWQGDTNFMPVLGDTNVIPQSLSDTYRLLKEIL